MALGAFWKLAKKPFFRLFEAPPKPPQTMRYPSMFFGMALLASLFSCGAPPSAPVGPDKPSIDTVRAPSTPPRSSIEARVGAEPDSSGFWAELDALPKSLEDVLALQQQIGQSPQGGAACFIVSMGMVASKATLGAQSLAACATGSAVSPSQEPVAYLGKALLRTEFARLREQLDRFPKLAVAYFQGASPDNKYSPEVPYRVHFSTNPSSGEIESGQVKLFVHTQGADSPRPLRLSKDPDGIWRVVEYSSLVVGIKNER